VFSPSCIFSKTSSAAVTVGIVDCVRSVSPTYENPAMRSVSPEIAALKMYQIRVVS
jgi:hypothetical protein